MSTNSSKYKKALQPKPELVEGSPDFDKLSLPKQEQKWTMGFQRQGLLGAGGPPQQLATENASVPLPRQNGLSRLCEHFPPSFANVRPFRCAAIAAKMRDIDYS
jgi:hypothetical protein